MDLKKQTEKQLAGWFGRLLLLSAFLICVSATPLFALTYTHAGSPTAQIDNSGNFKAWGNLTILGVQISLNGLTLDTAVANVLRVTGALNVTGNVNAQNVTASYFIGNGSQLTSVMASSLAAGSVLTASIADGNVTGAKIAAGTINPSNVNSSASFTVNNITAAYHIGNGSQLTSVTAVAVNPNAIVTASIADGNVTGSKIAASAVNPSNVNSSASFTVNNMTAAYFIGNGSQLTSITATSVAAGSVVTASIADGNVTGSKLAANSVNPSNVNSSASFTVNNITAAYHIGNGSQLTSVTAVAVNANSIVTASIADGNVTGSKIAASAVNPTNVNSSGTYSVAGITATQNVTGAYFIGNGSQLTSITATSVAAGSVVTASIADGNVTGSKLAANSVNPSNVNSTASYTVAGISSTGNVAVTGNVTWVSGGKMYNNGTELIIDY